ncbi:MAG: hypothetical protein HKO56_05320 [Bacteroidia bacterium]|nr:hypothetical protein [Bacteroidia bacterium]
MKYFLSVIAVTFCAAILFSFTANAQTWQLEEESTDKETSTDVISEVEDEVSDSVVQAQIMIIPFKPRMYLSDAERDIAKASKKQPEVNQRFFRWQVERSLVYRMQQNFGIKSLYFDTTQAAEEDLIRIYSSTNYSYQEPIAPIEKRSLMKFKKKKKQNAEMLDPTIANKYPTDGKNEYMSVQLRDYSILNELSEKYGTQYFLFINQFEIKTNYNNCLDIANKIYEREVIWHYTLMDKDGFVLLGNTTKAFFPTNNTKAQNIAYSCFPKMANEIAVSIPQ